MTVLDSTLDLVARTGWRIFPSVNKHPAIKDWPNTCSREPAQIHEWWRRWPDASPSLVTGPRNGVVVLDVDVGLDGDGKPYSGFTSLEDVFHWHETPLTPCVHTKRGGMHLYFSCDRLPDDDNLTPDHPAHRTAIKNSISNLAPHIDVRGWNGFVVLPAEGTGYSIDPSLDFSTPMLPAPAWFNHRRRKTVQRSDRERFDPEAFLRDAYHAIAYATDFRHRAVCQETFKVAHLVGHGLLDARRAKNEIQAACMAIGIERDGSPNRALKYFEQSWDEGLAAAARGGRNARR